MSKVVFVGNCCAGKTATVLKLCGKEPFHRYKPTVGVDMLRMKSSSGKSYTLWDFSGNWRSNDILKDADIVFVFPWGENVFMTSWESWVRATAPETCQVHVVPPDTDPHDYAAKILV